LTEVKHRLCFRAKALRNVFITRLTARADRIPLQQAKLEMIEAAAAAISEHSPGAILKLRQGSRKG